MGELTRYSLKEVARQNGRDGAKCWLVIQDFVYDVTTYMKHHPGGSDLLEEYAGQDATRGFKDFGHSSDAKKKLKEFLIGELIEEDKIDNRKKKRGNVQTNEAVATKNGKRRFLSRLCGNCA
ncbi:cytochrome b5-like [Ceratina calcarata]|uniref:Cytochrome b5-like n=1 Tax=Ceratina calcarata TaxID=156304 RepID=A0AAJ7N6N0_9HYME|nr:cytochrome b5-like [Ceratina calcarata]